MWGSGKPKPVSEHEASGEIESVYHDLRQTLRVSGVNLVFRTWAGTGRLLPVVWNAVRPNVQTRAFENAADAIRAEAAGAAEALGRIGAAPAGLGESQSFQLRAALDLYRYVTPKLLVLTSAVRLALEGEEVGGGAGPGARLTRGVPERMYPMEMVAEDTDEEPIQELFRDIRDTLGLSRVNSLYRTLALWPDYLEPAWAGLKPIARGSEHGAAADRLRALSRDLARSLPHPVPLSRERLEEKGEDADALIRTAAEFEELIPGVVLNTMLFALDWGGADELARSPFPAPAGGEA